MISTPKRSQQRKELRARVDDIERRIAKVDSLYVAVRRNSMDSMDGELKAMDDASEGLKRKKEDERIAVEEVERERQREAERVAAEKAERVAAEIAEQEREREAERAAAETAERIAAGIAERERQREAERIAAEEAAEAERYRQGEAERMATKQLQAQARQRRQAAEAAALLERQREVALLATEEEAKRQKQRDAEQMAAARIAAEVADIKERQRQKELRDAAWAAEELDFGKLSHRELPTPTPQRGLPSPHRELPSPSRGLPTPPPTRAVPSPQGLHSAHPSAVISPMSPPSAQASHMMQRVEQVTQAMGDTTAQAHEAARARQAREDQARAREDQARAAELAMAAEAKEVPMGRGLCHQHAGMADEDLVACPTGLQGQAMGGRLCEEVGGLRAPHRTE